MDFIITAIAFLLIFSILVLVHEWGHFYAARRSGIKVEEFGFGMPPRAWGKKIGETIYSLNWIPFGGFVRLMGEDASDPKVLANKRSFASKSPRVRILVVTAGVLMNFLLAYVLLTLGFIFGIQPLILSADEVLDNLNKGTIHTIEGIVVNNVKEGSPAAIAGMIEEDRIIGLDGKEVLNSSQLGSFMKGDGRRAMMVTVERGGERMDLNLVAGDGMEAGFETYEILSLPRVVVLDVKSGSLAEEAGLRKGDVILRMNDRSVYFVQDYEDALKDNVQIEYTLMRDNEVITIKVDEKGQSLVVISGVLSDGPADLAGILKGDLIVEIQGEKIFVPSDLVEVAAKNKGSVLTYLVIRDGEEISLQVEPDETGMIGVGLSQLKSFEREQLSVYAADFPVSVIKIDDVRYPVWEAPVVAFNESIKLTLLTVEMAGGVFKSVFTQLSVPEGVAGPVGIAQLTHVFVQEGFLSVVRFVALLSLSLGIINILPFPALDGGRLIFILAEVVIGRRIGARFEGWVHAIGFLLLMLLIIAVTYSDILRLF